MADKLSDQIEQIIANLDQRRRIHADEIPDIGLYMDQVTTFMEDRLGHTRRAEDDKVLTKTMINNYTKHKLLPPPDKKKYSRDHLLVLIFIYYYKGILSLQDIRSLLTPLADYFEKNEDTIRLDRVYEAIFQTIERDLPNIKDSVRALCSQSLESFPEASGKDQDFLQYFSLVSSLALDVYIKKLVIEELIDAYTGTSA